MVLTEIGIEWTPRATVHQCLFMQRKRHAPDHAAEILALHQPRIDDAARRKGTDEASATDLAEMRINLHLGKYGAMGMGGVPLSFLMVCTGFPVSLQRCQTGAPEDVGVALNPIWVVAPSQTPLARYYARVIGTEQRRALVLGGQACEPDDDVTTRRLNGVTGRRSVAGSTRDATVRQVRGTHAQLDLVDAEAEPISRDLG